MSETNLLGWWKLLLARPTGARCATAAVSDVGPSAVRCRPMIIKAKQDWPSYYGTVWHRSFCCRLQILSRRPLPLRRYTVFYLKYKLEAMARTSVMSLQWPHQAVASVIHCFVRRLDAVSPRFSSYFLVTHVDFFLFLLNPLFRVYKQAFYKLRHT